MDYSKLRKILIILCIISVILSISKKAFAADINYDNTYNVKTYNEDINLPEAFKSNYWFICISNRTPSFNGFQGTIFYSDKEFIVTETNTSGSLTIPALSNAKIKTYQTSGPSKSLYDIQVWINSLSFDLSNITSNNYTNIQLLASSYNTGGVLSSNFDIKNTNGDIVLNKTNDSFLKPQIDNPQSEVENLNFSDLFISPNDFGINNNLYFKVLQVTNVIEDTNDAHNNIYYYNDLTFTLNKDSTYLKKFDGVDLYKYCLPYSALKLKKNTSYYFVLTNSNDKINQSIGVISINDIYYDVRVIDTANLITTNDEILNSIINDNPSDNTQDTINNGLPRPGYNENDVNIPGMNVDIPNDPTTSTFNWIFNYIYSILNSITETSQSVTLNFTPPGYNTTGNLFTLNINGNLVSQHLENYPLILNLIHSVYWFVVSYYIVNDVRKYVEKVKNGDIMTHTDTNIKADML